MILALSAPILEVFASEPTLDPPPAQTDAKKLNDSFWSLYFKLKRMKVEQKWYLSQKLFAGYVIRPLSLATTIINVVKPFDSSTASGSIGYNLSTNANIELEQAYSVSSGEKLSSIMYNLRW